MKRKIEEASDEPTAPFWMVTYGDMVTLLLTFFILLISFANLDEVKFEQAAHSLKGALGVMEGYISPLSETNEDDGDEKLSRKIDIINSVTQLKASAMELGLEDEISIEITDGGLLIQMGDKVLFDFGKAKLRPLAYPILNIVGNTIKSNSKEVLVGGHTDNIPINNENFQSNWELSTARALTVVKYLIDKADVPPEILAAIGFSEFRPLLPNTSDENRQTNRRVEFLVTWK